MQPHEISWTTLFRLTSERCKVMTLRLAVQTTELADAIELLSAVGVPNITEEYDTILQVLKLSGQPVKLNLSYSAWVRRQNDRLIVDENQKFDCDVHDSIERQLTFAKTIRAMLKVATFTENGFIVDPIDVLGIKSCSKFPV